MKKVPRFRKMWLNFIVLVQKKYLFLKKTWRMVAKSARPFLAPRYWVIYLISFAMGLYLFGPSHGIQKIRSIQLTKKSPSERPSIETLQMEIERLKREIKVNQTKKTTIEFNPGDFGRPVLGQVIQGFDWVVNGHAWRMHAGVDIKTAPGNNVMAAAAGTVVEIGQNSDGSFRVSLSHGDGWESVYSNLAQVVVDQGQNIIKGVLLGVSGSKGCSQEPSIHFEIYHDKKPVDPVKLIEGLAK